MKNLNPQNRSLIVVDQDYISDSWNNFFKDFGSFDKPVFRTQKTKNNFEPTCDITEAKEYYLIAMDLPGVEQKDLNIEVEGNQLKISGQRHKEASVENESKQIHLERSFGRFVRSFTLPAEINIDDIQAQHQSGVLKIAIPKTKKVAPKKVAINVTENNGFFQKTAVTDKEEI